ncbi:unnamed protein product [Caenorhabditis brenneri]
MFRQEVSSVVFRCFNGFRQGSVAFISQSDQQLVVKGRGRRIHSNHVKFFGISTTSSAGNVSSHNWSSEQQNKSTHWDNSSSSSQQHQSFRHFYVKNRRIDRKALFSSESTNGQEQSSG